MPNEGCNNEPIKGKHLTKYASQKSVFKSHGWTSKCRTVATESKTVLGGSYSKPVTWGAGGGGARVAIKDEFARWSKMDSRWKKCLFTSPALLLDRWADISAILVKWKDASLSQPPKVSTTSGTKVITWRRHEWKCLPILVFIWRLLKIGGA